MQLSRTPFPVSTISAGQLTASVFFNRQELGKAAALHILKYLKNLQNEQNEIRMVVGSAPSQDEFFENLTSVPESKQIDWSKIIVFHMDEYVGLSANHPQSFRTYQFKHFVNKVQLKDFHPIKGEASDPEKECIRISTLLSEAPIDLVCAGIGENGHLAFNDPPVADFDDPKWAKIVELDRKCRQQQVNDGCFATIEEVPKQAITLTLKVFSQANKLICVVPGRTKAEAVKATLYGPISTACPATLTREHPNARLFLDPDSAASH
ncbi:glucosamine-6-phosphate deaminase [Puniceicoccaceae bacterium K14]|nr:glucosamine-6-phosphate deaminase [Puniceicoccaceae bacterium K14]